MSQAVVYKAPMADIPTTEPTELRAGDTWAWTITLADYPAPAWALKYSLLLRGGNGSGAKKTITATASGTNHAVTVDKTTTAGYAAGIWDWVASVTNGTSRYTLDSGALTVLFDIEAQNNGIDLRSHAAKTLAALEAWIEARDIGVAEYEIAGRRLKTIPIEQLIKLRTAYRAEVNAETRRADIKAGIGIQSLAVRL